MKSLVSKQRCTKSLAYISGKISSENSFVVNIVIRWTVEYCHLFIFLSKKSSRYAVRRAWTVGSSKIRYRNVDARKKVLRWSKFNNEKYVNNKRLPLKISSASNCTDFQSRRLHIKYIDDRGDEKFVHTVGHAFSSSWRKLNRNIPFVQLNGTAMAIPRMLTAIVENNWQPVNVLNVFLFSIELFFLSGNWKN